jgi:alkylation response protein AidB-like acyl-CoA dehydrogenase
VNLGLTDDQQAVRAMFATLFAKESTPERVRDAESSGFDEALWKVLVELGVMGIAVPVDLGGAGAGILELALIAEEAGRTLAAVPLAEPWAAARLLARLEQPDLLIPALDGNRLVSLAPAAGPVDQQLLADGAIADSVLARSDQSVVVAERPEQVERVSNLGALPLARWEGANARILQTGLGAVNAFERARDDVRVLRAAALVGLTARVIEIGADYAKDRRAFGVPIGSYQAVAHPLADAAMFHDGAQLLVWKACWALDAGDPDGPALASMAFTFAAETAYRAAEHSLHIHGGYGFMEEYDVQLYYRRAKAWTTVFGDPRRELVTIADRRLGPAVVQPSRLAGEQ